MFNTFNTMGPYGPVLAILAIVVAVLIVKKSIDLFARKNLDESALGGGLHAILFWGAMSALLGVLGQLQGIYRALNIISRASELSPAIIAQGYAESLTTTIFGLFILAVAAIAWFILLARYRALVAGRR